MDHFEDIDGNRRMAGSPPLDACAEIQLKEVLGLNRGGNSSALIEMSKAKEPYYANKAKQALELVRQALSALTE